MTATSRRFWDSPAVKLLSEPAVSIPAWALLAAGTNTYGNLLAENELQKGDNRLILESAMTGAGAALGGVGAMRLRDGLTAAYQSLTPAEKAKIQAVLAQNPEIVRLKGVAHFLGRRALGSAAGGFAGSVLAPFIAANLHLMGVPGVSGRQQDFVDEDRARMQAEVAGLPV